MLGGPEKIGLALPTHPPSSQVRNALGIDDLHRDVKWDAVDSKYTLPDLALAAAGAKHYEFVAVGVIDGANPGDHGIWNSCDVDVRRFSAIVPVPPVPRHPRKVTASNG